ncbi:ATP-binding protein [Nocardioides sp. LS1]|uniref:ATP-binding protein n=1 Tax=Nocardioides sp. LS1 TaxID=1027620 RepID=UPI000F624765|nr:ATP-binding protein [Nocardioides sp. LS1]
MAPSSTAADLTLTLELDLDGPEVQDDELGRAMEAVTQQVTIEAVTRRAGELLMLHACALADPATGRCVLFVGPSGMGKSTIAWTLGRDFGYVTDETAAVTADGRLVAYPKPLSIRAGGPAKEQHSPDDLNLVNPGDDLSVAAVLLLDRQPEQPFAVERLPTVEGVALLAEHTSFLGELDAPLQRLAALCEDAGGLRRASYRDAAELKPLVARLLATGSEG